MQVEVKGLASGRMYPLEFAPSDLDTDLLTLLRSKGITIASSCDGEGVCKKCVIQNDWLTCEITLRAFLSLCPDKVIKVSYL